MKEMSLQDIKNVSLEVLSDVDDFCRQHNINYSLAFGTQIGAIRHKGFIPWDDDIDIVMPRPDYERFCSIYFSKNGYALFHRKKGNSDIAFARVCDMDKSFVDCSYLPWSSEKTGIWIDVFPIDGFSSDSEKAKNIIYLIKKYYNSGVRYRRSKAKYSTCVGVIDWLKLSLYKLIYGFGSKQIDKHMELINQLPYVQSMTVASLSCPNMKNFKDIYKKTIFDEYIDVEFEGLSYRSVKDYDSMLRASFGDYMQLPPEEDRVSSSQGFYKYYWK